MSNTERYDISDLLANKPPYLMVKPTRAELYLPDYVLPDDANKFSSEVNTACKYARTLPFRGDQRSDIECSVQINNIDIAYLTHLSKPNWLDFYVQTYTESQYIHFYSEHVFLRGIYFQNNEWKFNLDRRWVDVDIPKYGVGDYSEYFKNQFGSGERAEKEYRQSLIDHVKIGEYITELLNKYLEANHDHKES